MNFLFLDPFAAVGGYHRSLVALAREFLRLGHSMTFVHCQEAMSSGCTGMNALGVADEAAEDKKREICRLCLEEARASASLGLWQTRWLLPAGPRPVKAVPGKLPRWAAYELLLQKKVETLPSRGTFPKNWRERQKRLLAILPQAEKILSEKPYDGIVCYNSLYGIHHLFLELGRKKGIPTLCLHHSFNCSKEDEYVLFRGHVFDFLDQIRRNFRPDKPLATVEMKAIRDHSQALSAGLKPWAYSLPQNGQKSIGQTVNHRKKVLVCLSSPDENFAAQYLGVLPSRQKHVHAFRDQIGWLRWIRKLARRNPRVLFWVRPHPRLYPNKREGQISQLAKKLERERKKPGPFNFYWPDQKEQGPVWQHLENTDVVFNAWSTLADEFGQKGIPVLTFFPNFSNSRRKIDQTGTSAYDYEKKFNQALQLGISSKAAKRHKRWLADFLCCQTFQLKIRPSRWIRAWSHLKAGLNQSERFHWALSRSPGCRPHLADLLCSLNKD
jgi:hypothetical protein